jgi:DNA repair exonuclease SbcCD ATPase subunit
MVKNYRRLIDKQKVRLELLKRNKKHHTKEIQALELNSKTLHSAREIFQKAATLTQNHLATHLSSIVTKAIKTVFYEKDISFHVEFTGRRNVSECDMWIEEDGNRYSILDSRGYGMVDIISFSLKVAYILLHTSDNVIILDEPFRQLSLDKHAMASEVLKQLSKELDIQFIIATHSEYLKEYADRAFHVKQDKNGISKIKETS